MKKIIKAAYQYHRRLQNDQIAEHTRPFIVQAREREREREREERERKKERKRGKERKRERERERERAKFVVRQATMTRVSSLLKGLVKWL